jgi:RecA-family ATPase
MKDDEFDGAWEELDGEEFLRKHSSRSSGADIFKLTIEEWRSRELPPPDKLLGEWMTTTSRILLTADTGLGKTNLCMAFAGNMAAGVDFLHWRAHRPAKVLYIDGEMSRRLLKRRIEDVVRRLGFEPDNLLCLSSEDVEDFPPLNTPEGMAFLDDLLVHVGGVEFCFFDNIMALIQGDQKDELGWTAVLPLINRLTKRGIGQLWIHHTGHDASRGYGTKTREWRMDTVVHLMEVERTDTDICFQFEFRKARERTPESRTDFQDVTIALVED